MVFGTAVGERWQCWTKAYSSALPYGYLKHPRAALFLEITKGCAVKLMMKSTPPGTI
jgi:hypothetical protein